MKVYIVVETVWDYLENRPAFSRVDKVFLSREEAEAHAATFEDGVVKEREVK